MFENDPNDTQYANDIRAQRYAAQSVANGNSLRRALPRADEAQRAMEIVLGCVREDISLSEVRRAIDAVEAHLAPR